MNGDSKAMRSTISTIAFWCALTCAVAMVGCALMEEPTRPGEKLVDPVTALPVIDPVTGEQKVATISDAIASIDAVLARISALETTVTAAAGATNPLTPIGLGGTAIATIWALASNKKKAQLLVERAKLVAALNKANVPLPAGVTESGAA